MSCVLFLIYWSCDHQIISRLGGVEVDAKECTHLVTAKVCLSVCVCVSVIRRNSTKLIPYF